jgi:uncharacterized protein
MYLLRIRLLFILLIVCIAGNAFAALHFPALTGRVVDDAHILSPQAVRRLDAQLADYERGTGNQVVVVTLPSLQGTDIADYGYQLGRAWGIGQKGKDNGVLLIVAPAEHKVRIEVGYGLEGTLTDAQSSVIVQQVILPQFRAGHLQQGILDGTQALLDTLGGHGVPASQGASGAQASPAQLIFLLIFLFFFFRFAMRHPFLAMLLMSGNSSRFGGRFGGGSGSGFSGGGGSFGGGGASGSW